MGIIVVGAGFSGAALAIQLARRGAEVQLLGTSRDFGRGLAYAAAEPAHLLNVPAERMGLDPEAPGDFADFLGLVAPNERRGFLPRLAYGIYLEARLGEAAAASRGRLQRMPVAVAALERCAAGWRATLADGSTLEDAEVVLALGSPAALAGPGDGPAGGDGRWIRDPWAPGALARIGPEDPVLVLGTGLTMVDLVVSLTRAGHRGPLLALSRRGRLPRPHPAALAALPAPPDALLEAIASGRLAASLAAFRAEVAAGASPDALADSLRAATPGLWRAWSPATRARFLRHLRPWWDAVRHRVPAHVLGVLKARIDEGLLQVRAGRVLAHADGVARVRLRGEAEPRPVPAAWVLQATGLDGRLDGETAEPLRGLLLRGEAVADPLGLGLACDADGAVIGFDGRPTPGLHALGGLRRGECWESTAVPDLREHARRLAARLAP